MRSRIFWAVVAGFLIGVFARSILPLSWPFAALFVLLALGSLFYGYVDLVRRDVCIVLAVGLVCCSAGMLRMDGAVRVGEPELTHRVGSQITVEGVVSEEPDVRENSVRLAVDASQLITKTATTTIQARLLVVAPAHTALSYGDRIRAKGELRLPEAFDTGAGHSFDYPMYLAKDGILYELSFANVSKIGDAPVNPAKRFALSVKEVLLSGLYRSIPEPEAGLAAGITLGEKKSLGEDLSNAFVRASLIHIVVLSGYNITVVINAAASALVYVPRIFRFGTSALIVSFFILMTGGAATAVRAGFMAFLAVYARLTGRTFIAVRALAAAAFLMVAWNPFTLLYDPSFELSALATLGLVLFTPACFTALSRVPVRFGLREAAASTIATQITVLPLLLYQSGNFSLVALPANLLALVAVPPAMALSSISALLGLLLGPYAAIPALPAYICLTYIVHIAQFFASLPFASVTIPAFSAWLLVAAYSGLFGGYAIFHKRSDQTR